MPGRALVAPARRASGLAARRGPLLRVAASARTLSSSTGSNGAGDPPPPRKSDSFVRKTRPVIKSSTLAGAVLCTSVVAALGSLVLVSQDGKEQLQSRSYLSVPSVELSRRFSTSGSAGAAVTIEAFSVGEQISPESLLMRYAFDEHEARAARADAPQDDALPEASASLPAEQSAPAMSTDEDHHHHQQQQQQRIPLRRRVSRRKQMQVIGKGAYGRVVRAVDRSTGRKVAMKVVPHTAMSAEALLEEVEVLKRVRGHDNIIHLNEVLYCGGKYYVVTELCEGGEVLDYLISHGPFTERSASTLTTRVADALMHIHRCGYVHLDLKPENLVFANKKNLADCRIIDFGMARKISEVAGKLSMVRGDKGARVGTLAYWSPEQVRSIVGKDGRNLSDMERTLVRSDPRACDMWALGVMLYIMLLGCHPFDPTGRGDEREMARAIQAGRYRFDVHGERLRISEAAKHLITGLLDPNPVTRFTATDVLEHPFVTNLRANRKLSSADKLPTSWTLQGYKVSRDEKVDLLVDSADEARLKPFGSERTGEAFARVLLMAVAANGRNVYLNETGDNSTTSDALFQGAFRMFEGGSEGRLTPSSVESLLRVTGDEAEDDVVVSYHRHASDPPTRAGSEQPEEGIDVNEFKAYLRKLDCVTRYFKAGEVVFAQGSVPQGFYVLLNGKARLEYEDAGARAAHYSYAKLGPGSVFGEAALIKGARTRSSTVRCTKPSEVLFIPKDLFLRALAGSPALNEILFKVAMKQQATRLHELVEHLNPKGMVTKEFRPGDVLFRQGERADFLYLIREGLVGSNTSAPSSRARGAEAMSIKIAERGQGDLIGTSAATGGGGMRYSTAKCITPVRVLAIPAGEIMRLRREEPVFSFYLENLIQARKEFWQSQISDLERGVSEPQLLPLLLQSDEGEGDPEAGGTGATAGEATPSATPSATPPATPPATSSAAPPAAPPAAPRAPEPEPELRQGQNQSLAGAEAPRQGWAGYALSWVNPLAWARYSGLMARTPAAQPEAPAGLEHIRAFEEYSRTISNMKRIKFEPGEHVYQKGDRPQGFFIVNSGTLSVEYVGDHGKVLSVAQLGPGDHFGEQALVEDLDEYLISVRCVSGAEVLFMEKDEFFELMGDGQTKFAQAIRHALKLRQHRWVRNLLKLAKEDKRERKQEAYERRLQEEAARRRMRRKFSQQLQQLIEPDAVEEEEESSKDEDFIDRDTLRQTIEKYSSEPVVLANTTASGGNGGDGGSKSGGDMGGVTRIMLQPGDVLFRRGDPVDAIYMVHRGELELHDQGRRSKLRHGVADGEAAEAVSKLSPGDTVGLEQCGAGGTHAHAAVCSAPHTIVSKIPQDTLDRLIEGHEFVSQQLKRHARRTIPFNEVERRAGAESKFGSQPTTLFGARERGSP